MKYNCEIVRDLLPLYADQVCSGGSKEMVENHLAECESCRKIAGQAMDHSIEKSLLDEKRDVLLEHQKVVKKKTYMIGMATAGLLMIPVIVCLICNLATQHALDWFFIVLTSMLLVASVTVVPMVVYEKKLMWAIVSSVVSLFLLLMSCCIYTGGDWFWVAGTACMLGVSVVFAPFVVRELPMKQSLKNHKASMILAWDCLWLYLLLVVCGIFVNGGQVYWQLAIGITTYVLIAVWLWLIILRYMKQNPWMKAGILLSFSGLWMGFSNDILNFFLQMDIGNGLSYLNLKEGFRSADSEVQNANILFTVMMILIGTGAVLLLIGIWKPKSDTAL